MGYTAGVDRATGYKVTAANWNEQLGATGSLVTVHDALYTCTQSIVTGSRALDANYQNTSGKTMIVTVACTGSAPSWAATAYVEAGDSTPDTAVTWARGNDAADAISMTFCVPAGSYYSVANTGNALLSYWTEWTIG